MVIRLNSIRFSLNLWLMPVVLAAIGIALLLVSRTFSGMLDPLRIVLSQLAALPLAASVLYALHSTFKLWQAANGVGELCHVCGGPTRLVDPGRYSPHYRCLQCGNNRRAH